MWSDTLKWILAFAKLPDSGDWLEDIRADNWRGKISALTDPVLTTFKDTRDGTERTESTYPNFCMVLATWNGNVPYAVMAVT